MKLKDILTEDQIIIPLTSHSKEDVIKEMVDYLYDHNKIEDKNKILKAILDREKVMSTGVGNRVAIPHGKAEGINDIVALFGIADKDIDFHSIDNVPVRLIFMLVGPPDKTGPHLKALSRISRLMHNQEFRERLMNSQTAHEVMTILEKEEEKYFEIS
ncbi:MAG: PTS sugar transporter subunit IIA [candidate division KSB1 bacterium]|jgi:fructose-specific phosphotransferase system IIA component|nr:PTS sugar transporter subunit IIA [candidate division KSB1 bacterium]